MRAGAARAFVLGAACSAALLAGGLATIWWMFPTVVPQPPAPPLARAAPAGNIANWPEIKNGVPQVIATPSEAPAPSAQATVPSPPLPPVPATPRAPPAAPPTPAAPAAAPAVPPTSTAASASSAGARPAIALAEPPPVPDPMLGLRASEPPPLRGPAQLDAAEQPAGAIVAAAPDSAAEAGARDEQVPALTPLPPRRPVLEQPPVRRQHAPRQRAAAAPPDAAPVAAEPAPQEAAAPTRPSILGVPIPDIIPSGRRVKECLLELKC